MMVDGILEDVIIAPPKDVPPLGTVFAAKTERPLKGTGGQFVRLPGGGRGFLKANMPQGRIAMVQVSGFTEPGKAIPVTSRIVLKGATAILTPGARSRSVARSIKGERADALKALAASFDLPDEIGVILRSAAVYADAGAIKDEVHFLAEKAALLEKKPTQPQLVLAGRTPEEWARSEWDGGAMWDESAGNFALHGIDEQLSYVLSGETDLPSGGSVFVEETRALVAVDVNSGGANSGNQGLTATLEAIEALPRLLRLRGLGGQITIDCAPFGKAHRRTVEQRIARAFGADSVETSLVGWTPLGHIELTRKRERHRPPQER